KALRPGNYDPQLIRTDNTNLEHVLVESVHTQLQRLPGGLIGIIVAAEFRWHFQQLLEANFAHRVWTGAGRRRHRDIVLVSAQQANGLEYDAVVIVEPQNIVTAACGSVCNLYVGLSRATNIRSCRQRYYVRLCVVTLKPAVFLQTAVSSNMARTSPGLYRRDTIRICLSCITNPLILWLRLHGGYTPSLTLCATVGI